MRDICFSVVVMRALKYLLVFTLPLAVGLSWGRTGWVTFLPVLYAFGLIPLLELFLPANRSNLSQSEVDQVRANPLYNLLLYLVVPVQYAFLYFFVQNMADSSLDAITRWGMTAGMGLMCGVLAINVGHELGHRTKRAEQRMAQALLLTSQYAHFYIEHNLGHHKHVSTPEDPSSARMQEALYPFWWRTVSGTYRSAWQLEAERLKRAKQSFWSLHNQMLWFTALQMGLLVGIAATAGFLGLMHYLAAALLGILLLETVNYIEHYGLARQKISAHRYEDAQPQHSWNSNHLLGRLLLFELSRHSDHHYLPHKPYPLLDHHEESPQMPTGYPGMMLLALVPPLWFRVMNPRAQRALER
jgi:alkane 1-monooxygenase